MEVFLFTVFAVCGGISVLCGFTALSSERSKKAKCGIVLLSVAFAILAAFAVKQSQNRHADNQALKRDAAESCIVRYKPVQGCYSFTLLDVHWTVEPKSPAHACLREFNIGVSVLRYKPVPRADLVIVYRADANVSTWLTIQVTTPNAETWLVENAPEFGRLENGAGDGVYHLYIYTQAWNVDRVVDYIEDVGNSQ